MCHNAPWLSVLDKQVLLLELLLLLYASSLSFFYSVKVTVITDCDSIYLPTYLKHFYLPNPSNQFNFSLCNLCTVS